MARITMADLLARIATLEAERDASAPIAAASGHFKARDLPCTATPPCKRTFRTAARAAIHGVANGGHEPGKPGK